jgi:AcrR family transcriptional regulator
MPSADTRRTALLNALADHLLSHGLGAASLRPMAKAAGTSDRMLLYYFPDKDALITAVLGRVAERLTLMLADIVAPQPLPLDQLRAHLANVLLADRYWPYMRLWLDMAARAANGETVYATVGRQLGEAFVAWGSGQLASDNVPRDAARLIVAIEGMVLLKSLGLEDVARRAI